MMCIKQQQSEPVGLTYSHLHTPGKPNKVKCKRYIYYLLILLFLVAGNAPVLYAQIFPVSTVTSVLPPAPTSLDGFVDQAASKINLQIVVNDVTLTNHPVKLRMILKSNNVRISTSGSLILQPMYLHGGETMVLTAADLAAYFRPEHLDFSGVSKSQYLRTGQLPDGIYQLSFEVLDYQRNFVISSAIPAFVYLFVNDPPVLNTPLASKQIDITGQQNILFNWSFRHSPFSSPAFQPEYQLDIWEIYPENLDPYAVVRTSQPVFSERTRNTSFHYSDMHPQLLPGRKYAWRVQAVDPQSIAAFKENGYSQVRWFKYGTACDAPVLKAGKAGTTHLNVEWETPQYQKDFSIRYRPEQPKDAPWYTAKTSFLSHKLENLRPNTAYIVEVSGRCGTQESPASNNLTLRTSLDLNFQCGQKGNIPRLENQTPIPHLQKGNFIKAGDFEVEVYQVQGNGVFNGKGYVLVPLFNFIKLDAVLENVQVNSDFQLIGGSIRTIYDVNNSAMVNLTGIVNSLMSDTRPETNDFANVADIKVNAGDSIVSVTIRDNVVTVVSANGNTSTEKIEPGKIVAITAPEGQQYVIDGSTKTVYTSSSPGGEAPKASRLSNTEANASYKVSFAPYPGQFYGFDSVPTNAAGKWYHSRTIGGTPVYLPWKSVESGRYDKLIAKIEGTPADSVFFSRESASMVMAAPGKTPGEKQLMITGQGHRNEDELFAWYRTTTGDTVKKATNWLAGAVNVVSYEKRTIHLELVSVNGAPLPNADYIRTHLDSIYKPAIVNWVVTTCSKPVNIQLGTDNIFNNEDPDENMNYTESEKLVIKTFKEQTDVAKNKLYLFLIPGKTNNSDLKGYMPFNRKYGFVFTENNKNVDELIRTIAHEPGHGAFRLRHTFSPKISYIQPQYSTDNLMDYANLDYLKKTRLVKYQWDECHDWDLGLNWGEEEDEGESQLISDPEFVREFLSKFRIAYLTNKKMNIEKDRWPYFGHHAKDIKIDVNTYNSISISILTSGALTISTKPTTYSTIRLGLWGGTFAVYKNGPLEIEVEKENFTSLMEYLFPTMTKMIMEIQTSLEAKVLKPEEISDVRAKIAALTDQELKENYYIDLQAKVQYRNQRNNTSIDYETDNIITEYGGPAAEGMCNLTSMAMAFEYLGITNPCSEKTQFEDCLESKKNNVGDDRSSWVTRKAIAGKMGVTLIHVEVGAIKNKSFYLTTILPLLKQGSPVIISMLGHIVRVQNITENGIIVDDPYGKVSLDVRRNNGGKGGWVERNSTTDEGGNTAPGSDVLWEWSQVEKTSLKMYEYYKKN